MSYLVDTVLIHTPLQRGATGANKGSEPLQRFLTPRLEPQPSETAEAVSYPRWRDITPLKRGVNDICAGTGTNLSSALGPDRLTSLARRLSFVFRRSSFPFVALAGFLLNAHGAAKPSSEPPEAKRLPRILVAPGGRAFITERGKPFVPFGVSYYRPHTGWAPQLWKQFDAEATRGDFAKLRGLGATCVRVFLSYGSFYQEPGALSPEGLAKFDQFLLLAEAAGLYVHPTGPDHWEGTPPWARGDRYADEQMLAAVESFWKLFAARYRGRKVIFAYDLLNEPEIRWDTTPMRGKWNLWLKQQYGTPAKLAAAWGLTNQPPALDGVPVPPAKDAPGDRQLLDFQRFRESIAVEWTRRQAAAIKAADPAALVTVGLIQWSVPALLGGVQHYSAFRPEKVAPWLDFLEIHFYPLAKGFYEYGQPEGEARNLAYLETVVREVARVGKPVVVAEFGWYGGGQLTIDQGKHPPAAEEQQAQWCRHVVERTAGLATGWLNWGCHDHPKARDVSQLSGLFTVEGRVKAWGRAFQGLAKRYGSRLLLPPKVAARPVLDWDLCVTSPQAATQFREAYFQAFKGKVK
jgi:hypothetical protein